MFCSHCGAELEDDAKVCSQCGQPIADNGQARKHSAASRIRRINIEDAENAQESRRPAASVHPAHDMTEQLPDLSSVELESGISGNSIGQNTLNLNEVVRAARNTDAVSADTVKLDPVSTDSVKLDAVSTDTVKLDAVSTDTVKLDPVSTDTIKLDAVSTDTVKLDPISDDAIRSGTSDVCKSDADRIGSGRFDSDRIDSDRFQSGEPEPDAASQDTVILDALDFDTVSLDGLDLSSVDLEDEDPEAGSGDFYTYGSDVPSEKMDANEGETPHRNIKEYHTEENGNPGHSRGKNARIGGHDRSGKGGGSGEYFGMGRNAKSAEYRGSGKGSEIGGHGGSNSASRSNKNSGSSKNSKNSKNSGSGVWAAVGALLVLAVIVGAVVFMFRNKVGGPNYSDMILSGNEYYTEGSYDKAAELFNKAVEAFPEKTEGYMGLADVYIAQKDEAKAAQILEEGYDRTHSGELKQKLDELQGNAPDTDKPTEAPPQTDAPVQTTAPASESSAMPHNQGESGES